MEGCVWFHYLKEVYRCIILSQTRYAVSPDQKWIWGEPLITYLNSPSPYGYGVSPVQILQLVIKGWRNKKKRNQMDTSGRKDDT
jgi:hypothetical protein